MILNEVNNKRNGLILQLENNIVVHWHETQKESVVYSGFQQIISFIYCYYDSTRLYSPEEFN